MPSNSSILGKQADMEQDIIALGTPLECYSSRLLTYSKQFVSIQTVKYGLVLSQLASYEIQLYRATVYLKHLTNCILGEYKKQFLFWLLRSDIYIWFTYFWFLCRIKKPPHMLNFCGNSLPKRVYCLPFYHNGIEDGSNVANPRIRWIWNN